MNMNTKKILIVEDEKPLCEAIKIKLSKAGIKSYAVHSAEEAIEFLKKDNIDLIWLDIRLPKMNGLQFLEFIRLNPEWKNKKVVIVSVSGSYEIMEKAKDMGAIDYIVKSELRLDNIIKRVIAVI